MNYKQKQKYVSFDTEYKSSNQPFLTPVCASLKDEVSGEIKSYFVYNNETEKNRFIDDFRKYIEEGYFIIVFTASAETRFLLSVGFEPIEILDMNIIDLYPLWSMLNHSLDEYRYGKMEVYDRKVGKYIEILTRKPKPGEPEYGDLYYDETLQKEVFNDDIATKPYGRNLLDCIKRMLDVNVNSIHKDFMRDVILYNKEYSETDIVNIIDYNISDIIYLFPLLKKLYTTIRRLNSNFTYKNMLELSSWMVSNGIIENIGIPVDIEKIKRFSKNSVEVKQKLYEECNNVYPFYEQLKNGKYVFRRTRFEEYINNSGMKWDRTEKGAYKQNMETLKLYRGLKEIDALYTTMKSIKNIDMFSADGKKSKLQRILNNVGDDSRIRVMTNPFGSITSRSQPGPSGGYIFGMSKWLRTLITTDDNHCIIGADYSAQEILLQAVLAGDTSFRQSYISGDPYTFFAQKSGVMNQNVVRKNGKFYLNDVEVSEKDQQINKNIRTLFKAVLLGVGYGMGFAKLSDSLNSAMIKNLSGEMKQLYVDYKTTNDPDLKRRWDEYYDNNCYVPGINETKNYPTNRKAKTYKEYHQSVFIDYWRLRDSNRQKFSKEGCLYLQDGWTIFRKQDHKEGNDNSILNFPIQGTGATILRRAVNYCIREGLEVFSTLHDAIYIRSLKCNEKKDKELLVKCMKKAAEDVLKDNIIRVDAETYSTDWDTLTSSWTKEDGYEELKKYGEYFTKVIGLTKTTNK